MTDVVLETRVLVSRRLGDKNKSLGLCLEHLVLVSVLKKKSCSFSRLVVNLDGSEQGTPWHFVRDNKSTLPFGSNCLRVPCTSASVERYLTMGLFVRLHRRQ